MSGQKTSDKSCAMCESTETTAVIITEEPIEGRMGDIEPSQVQYLCDKHYGKVISDTDYSIREVPVIQEGEAKRRELSEEVLLYNPDNDSQWMKWDEDSDIEQELSDLT